MAYYGVFVQKLLIVELLRKHFFLRGRADYCALIRKYKLLLSYPAARFLKKSRFLHLLEVEKQNSGVYVIRIYEILAVMVARGGIFGVGAG